MHIAQSLLRHACGEEKEGAKDKRTFKELNFTTDTASREAWKDTRLSIHGPASLSGSWNTIKRVWMKGHPITRGGFNREIHRCSLHLLMNAWWNVASLIKPEETRGEEDERNRKRCYWLKIVWHYVLYKGLRCIFRGLDIRIV